MKPLFGKVMAAPAGSSLPPTLQEIIESRSGPIVHFKPITWDEMKARYPIGVLLHAILFTEPGKEGWVIDVPSVSTMWRYKDFEGMASAFEGAATREPRFLHAVPVEYKHIYLRVLGSELEERLAWAMATMHGGDIAAIHGDGMRAITQTLMALIDFSRDPDKVDNAQPRTIVVASPTYGCTDAFFDDLAPRRGVKTVRFNPERGYDIFEDTLANDKRLQRVRILFTETLQNPGVTAVDIARLYKAIETENRRRPDDRKIWLVIDNTFAGPTCCQPLRVIEKIRDQGQPLTAVVIESLTKVINHRATGLGGAAVVPWALYRELVLHRRVEGGVLAPQQMTDLLWNSIPMLSSVVAQMQANANRLSLLLDRHPLTSGDFSAHRVLYPGLPSYQAKFPFVMDLLRDWDGVFAPGYMMSAVLRGHEISLANFANFVAPRSNTALWAVSLGFEYATLLESPTIGTHSTVPPETREMKGITPGMLRISAGGGLPTEFNSTAQDILDALDVALALYLEHFRRLGHKSDIGHDALARQRSMMDLYGIFAGRALLPYREIIPRAYWEGIQDVPMKGISRITDPE